MPVRKLTRSGGGDQDGSQPLHVDNAAVDVFVESLLASQPGQTAGAKQAAGQDHGQGQHGGPHAEQQPRQTGGQDQGQGQESWQVPKYQPRQAQPAPSVAWAPPAARLRQSTAEVIAALHQAKTELAQEMEANLKQLKAVLQETQRIAKDMEAVLAEAKGQPAEDKQQQESRGQAPHGKQGAWDPPGLKQKADDQGDDQDNQSDDDKQDDQSPPAWEPPPEASTKH